MKMGLDITGINAEVMLGQWEYQIFGKDALKLKNGEIALSSNSEGLKIIKI